MLRGVRASDKAAPLSMTYLFPDGARCFFACNPSEVRLYHHLHKLLQFYLWFPSKHLLCLVALAEQFVYFGWPIELRIVADVWGPVLNANLCECGIEEIPYRMVRTSGDDKIIRSLLLEHHPHSLYVISRKPPVAPRIEVPECDVICHLVMNACNTICDFPRDELDTTERGFMIEENTGAGV